MAFASGSGAEARKEETGKEIRTNMKNLITGFGDEAERVIPEDYFCGSVVSEMIRK